MSATVPVKPTATTIPARSLPRPLPPAALTIAAALWRALAVAVLFVAAGVLGLVLYAQAHAGRVFEGVSVGGVPIGGLTRPEARAALDDAWTAWATKPLSLRSSNGDGDYALVPADAGIAADLDAAVAAAMAIGRDGSPWQRSQAWGRGLVAGVDLPLAITVDSATAPRALAAAAPGLARPPVDARVAMETGGGPGLVPDRNGVAIDAGTTLAAVADRARTLSTEPVVLVTEPTAARVAAADLAPVLAEARGAVDAPLVIRAAGQTWHLPVADLVRLVAVDPSSGELIADRRALASVVDALAADIDREVADAGVAVEDGRLVAIPAVTGRSVNRTASLAALTTALIDGIDRADLVVRETAPAIDDAAAEAAAARGESLLDGGMTLTWSGGRASLGRSDLLRALTIRVDPDARDPFRFGLDEAVLAETLTPVAEGFDRPMIDASFRLMDGQVVVAGESRPGRALDLDRGIAAIRAAWGTKPGATAKLPVVATQPQWTARDAAAIRLGGDVLGEGGTWYGDSSDARRRNVELASAKVGGWLVPPGGEFSYVERIGDVDEAAGFVTGYGIIEQGGEFTTAPVIGGGICQVSTTIFQAAFWAGLPILERYQHPYYMQLYGEAPTGLPGLDAMVNIDPAGSLDLRFANTTGEWIAVEVFADGQNVWSRIVGTNPGWTVEVNEPDITNRTPADPRMYYTDSPELPAGTEKVVESATDGFDVAITRTVTKDGEVLDEDTVASSFTASRNLTMRGTGPAA